MASTESRASWNPAFMPDSAASLPPRDSRDDAPASIEQRVSIQTSQASWNPAFMPNSAADIPPSDRLEDTTTSNPEQIETIHALSEETKQQHDPAISDSFAGTIPRDLDWCEDDEVDPKWNLPRTEVDPFESMQQTIRTNSFPAVPPAHNPAAVPEHQLPESQAKEIIEQLESRPDPFADDGYEEDGFFAHATDDVPDMESRYEEGLPLVDHSLDAAESTADIAMQEADFGEHHNEGQEDSLGALPDAMNGYAHPGLERKSTQQVLDSMDFHNQGSSGAVGLGLQNDPEPLSNVDSTKEPTEEDLAAKWAEALGDELLDDEEFLDDGEEDDAPASVADTKALDPAALFADDEDGFLEDDDIDASVSQMTSAFATLSTGIDAQSAGPSQFLHQDATRSRSGSNRYLPPNAMAPPVAPAKTMPTSYIPEAPLFTDLTSQSRPSFNSTFRTATAPIALPPYSIPQTAQQPELKKAQSFVSQSKGGYSSPYDLPMEVVKPRKRTSAQQATRGPSNTIPPAVPPPRSSSIPHTGMTAPPPPPSRGSASSMSPPVANVALAHPPAQVPPVRPSAQQASSSFFEELPVVAKPKPSGRYTPQPATVAPGIQAPPLGVSPYPPQQPVVPPPRPSAPILPPAQTVAHGLVAPPKASPYAPLGAGPSIPPPVATSRYSPAPPAAGSSGTPPPFSVNRYASAPPPAHQPSSSNIPSHTPASVPPPPPLPHLPRTSSPLVHFSTAQHESSYDNHSSADNVPKFRRESSSHTTRVPSLPVTEEVDEQTGLAPPLASSPPQSRREQSLQGSLSPPRRLPHHAPDHRQSQRSYEPMPKPPQRSQTQSPSRFRASIDAQMGEAYQRPMSAHGQPIPRHHSEQALPSMANFSQMSTAPPVPSLKPVATVTQPRARPRGLSGATYIAPTDGRQHDPLQRWRGGPIFTWGVGGTVITSFPKEVPRYSMGQTAPSIVCSPGEIKVHNLKDLCPLEERLATFPGPLKGKGKKKEVLAWLTAGIDLLEKDNSILASQHVSFFDHRRKEERILLWKILKVMIEHDGNLEGSPAVEKAVREVLTPGLETDQNVISPSFTPASLPGIAGIAAAPEPVNPAAVDQVRVHLLRGDREKAVWDAVDKRLWAHALLISNTVSRDLYKKVAQEFIQKEVRGIGQNTESLAALYEIFAGNFEESIDELVPPSARAGFQMMSTQGVSDPARSALDGLDRWRETLGLILSNRSTDDTQAIVALGKLLAGYGRAEAAHTCYLFAPRQAVFSGVDDPYTNIVLLGSDHLRQPHSFDSELEPILLSEVYEYGLSLTAKNPTSAPHLAAYKVHFATVLAQSGQREKALEYCDAIAGAVTSTVRRSPYYNPVLLSELGDLNTRLKQSPKDDSSSWITKPTIDKVSGSVWAKFNKFVAGDENDTGSGPGSDSGAEVGPFARISGDTPTVGLSPTISRSPSTSDIYGNMNVGMPIPAPSKATGRYAPGGPYSPPALHEQSPYGSPQMPSFEQRMSGEHQRHEQPAYGGVTNTITHNPTFSPPASVYSPYAGSPYAPATEHNPYSPPQQHAAPQYEAPQPAEAAEQPSSYAAYVPTESSTWNNQTDTYVPSTNGGYEPPAYVPYEPEPMTYEPDSPDEKKPKKKSIMDDDDDEFMPKVASAGAPAKPAEKTKAENDREAEEAFRRAAEADAKKDAPAAPAKKGWGLTGWFSKSSSPSADQQQPQANKPIKAKLGEESSFVYDPELKRWVNKKAGGASSDATPSATPPPPRGPPRTASQSPPVSGAGVRAGPPMRTASAAPVMETVTAMSAGPTSAPQPMGGVPPAGPPSGPQRAVSESLRPFAPQMARTASSGSATSASGPPGVGGPPLSRPGTAASNASSIDDLLGPAGLGPRKRDATIKKAKRGRGYVDVMGDKAKDAA